MEFTMGSLVPLMCVLTVLPRVMFGCSPLDGERTLADIVKDSNFILLGTVRHTYPTPHISGEVYTAEMAVECILKGDTGFDVYAVNNVSHAGMVAGWCHSSEMTVGAEYIVFARSSQGELVPVDTPLEATTTNVFAISQLCGLSPRLPIGFSGMNPRCPTSVDENGCLDVYEHVPESETGNIEEGATTDDHCDEEHLAHDHGDDTTYDQHREKCHKNDVSVGGDSDVSDGGNSDDGSDSGSQAEEGTAEVGESKTSGVGSVVSRSRVNVTFATFLLFAVSRLL